MAVKIKLMRMGKIRAPQYRIVVADARTKRDGRAIETVGKYHPTHDPSFIEVDSDRVQHWLSVGAQPTEPVRAILRVTGDWQRFRGEPGAEGTLRHAEPKADKKVAYEAAMKASAGESTGEATTPKAKKAKKSDEAPAGDTTSSAGSPAEPSKGEATGAAPESPAEEAVDAAQQAVAQEGGDDTTHGQANQPATS